MARGARTARRGARVGRRGDPPDRVPRRGDLRGGAADRSAGPVLAGDPQADDRPRREPGLRRDVHRRGRERQPVPDRLAILFWCRDRPRWRPTGADPLLKRRRRRCGSSHARGGGTSRRPGRWSASCLPIAAWPSCSRNRAGASGSPRRELHRGCLRIGNGIDGRDRRLGARRGCRRETELTPGSARSSIAYFYRYPRLVGAGGASGAAGTIAGCGRAKRRTNSRAVAATSRQPLSIVSACPRLGILTISVTLSLCFWRL